MSAIEKLKNELELHKKAILEKQLQIELLEIDELAKTIPVQTHYGYGETIGKSRGNRITLNYSVESAYRINRGVEVVLNIEEGKLHYSKNKKSVSVENINWHKVLAIIRYYKLDEILNTISLTFKTNDNIGNSTFEISMYDISTLIKWEGDKQPKGMDVLINFFEDYFL